MTHVGVVNRYVPGTRASYPLGLALRRVGAIYVPVDVRDVGGALGGPGPPHVTIGGRDLDDLRLDGLLWRVSENDFYQFSDAQRLLAARLPMVNTLPCHQICMNKWSTSVALAAEGIPVVPSTLVLPGNPVPTFPHRATVIKPVVGARGRGVRVAAAGSVPAITEAYVAQPLVSTAIEDQVRTLVCGADVVLAAHRVPAATPTGGLQVNNLEAGGTPRPARVGPVREIATAAAQVLGGVLLGIDLVRWNGAWAVLEANSAPGLSGIASVSHVDGYVAAARAVISAIAQAEG